jgi:Ankyrin repeats (3 copies)
MAVGPIRKARSLRQVADMVDILVDSGGADVLTADDYGTLPIEYFEQSLNQNPVLEVDEPYVQRIVDRLKPEKPAIVSAIVEGNLEVLRGLLLGDTTLATTEYRNRTVIQYCISGLLDSLDSDGNSDGFLQILQLLIQNEASPNVASVVEDKKSAEASLLDTDDSGEPPLDRLCKRIREEYQKPITAENIGHSANLRQAIETLLTAGKETVAIGDNTKMMLHDCARRNESAMVKLLIETIRIDPVTPGRQGLTALHFAARSGQLAMVQYLLSPDACIRGTNETDDAILQQCRQRLLNATDDRGKTALDAARANEREDVIQLLESLASSN